MPDPYQRRAVAPPGAGTRAALCADPRGERERVMTTTEVVHGTGHLAGAKSFPEAAHDELRNEQLRANLRRATHTIRDKRARVVAEVPDWEALREAGRAIKADVMARLPELLERFEAEATRAGAVVHWAREAAGIHAVETDLAELIVQLNNDFPSHILVPAIHYNRTEIRDIFLAHMAGVDPDITDEPRVLAMAARAHLRRKFLSATVGISGANFAIAETGTLVVLESEGNGRMCLTLPQTLISVVGIEKILPTFADLGVFLQLLPRSSTGERMNPYTSMWTGVTPGDGPQNVHIVLLDNGRSATLADEVGRQALHCIRCSACMNVCPVYERVGGHAYGSVYPGPIGAILSPHLTGIDASRGSSSLPFASSLCGACYDVCPVKINIPEVLVHLRQSSVDSKRGRPSAERTAMRTLSWIMRDRRRYARALRAARAGTAPVTGLLRRRSIRHLPWPMSAWTASRDAPLPARQTFREGWAKR